MGELIKKLGKLKIGETELDIELNEGMVIGDSDVIHIQNDKVRYVFEKNEFIQISAMILAAKANLNYYKDENR